MRDCTCVGSCRGAEGLGVGWNCVVKNGSVEDARIGAPSALIERPDTARPPDWENTVLALRNVLTQLDGWQVQRLLESARAMAPKPCCGCERARPFADLCPRCFAETMEPPQKSEGNSARLKWALDNVYTIARRELRRLERAGASDIESVAGDRWGHVVRLCEQAGCQGRGVLRDNGGAV